MQHCFKTALGLLFASSLSTMGWSQNIGLEMRSVDLKHPTSGPNMVVGDAKQVVLGQLTDDAIPDAVVLHGPSNLYFLYAADRRNAWQKLTGTHTSPTLLPKGLGPTRDGILTVGPSGLQKLIWTGPTGSRTLASTNLPSTSAWIGAKCLQVVSTPTGTFQVMAIAAGNKKILRATWNPTTATLSPLGSLGVPPAVDTLCGVQWNSDNTIEYATTNGSGMRVFGASGNLQTDVPGVVVYSLTQTNTESLILADPNPNPALPSGVVWVRSGPGVTDIVSRVTQSGPQANSPWFGGLDVQSIALADLGGDARTELVAFCQGFATGLGVARAAGSDDFVQTPAYMFDVDRAHSAVKDFKVALQMETQFPSGTGAYGAFPNLGNAPAVAAMDLDGDGDQDLFLAGHPALAARSIVFLGAKVNEENAHSPLPEYDTRAWLPNYQVRRIFGTSTVEIDMGVIPAAPDSGPGHTATHVRVVVGTRNLGSTTMNDQPTVLVLPVTVDPQNPSTAPIVGFTQVDAPSGNRMFLELEISYLQLDAGGTMIKAFPAYHETVPLTDLQVDHVWTAYQDQSIFDGGTPGGSTIRPAVTPPASNPPSNP